MSDLLPILDVLEATVDGLRERGRAGGIPECCIREFLTDLEADRYPAQLRGSISGPHHGAGCYVPCSSCLARTVVA